MTYTPQLSDADALKAFRKMTRTRYHVRKRNALIRACLVAFPFSMALGALYGYDLGHEGFLAFLLAIAIHPLGGWVSFVAWFLLAGSALVFIGLPVAAFNGIRQTY